MYWIYEKNNDNTARFALGQVFDSKAKTLLCFGINPSTACPECLDNTIRKVISIAKNNGYENWIMLNVYPQRATNPNDIHLKRDENLVKENLEHIKKLLEEYADCEILFAYGNLISKRKFLKECLSEIVTLLNIEKGKSIKAIKLTKASNPVHPLYQANNSILIDYII